jgi:hypothetical protein
LVKEYQVGFFILADEEPTINKPKFLALCNELIEKDPFKRCYLLGCLWAFAKTTLNKRFYNLKRIKQKGLHTEIDFGFDQSKILTREQIAQQ